MWAKLRRAVYQLLRATIPYWVWNPLVDLGYLPWATPFLPSTHQHAQKSQLFARPWFLSIPPRHLWRSGRIVVCRSQRLFKARNQGSNWNSSIKDLFLGGARFHKRTIVWGGGPLSSVSENIGKGRWDEKLQACKHLIGRSVFCDRTKTQATYLHLSTRVPKKKMRWDFFNTPKKTATTFQIQHLLNLPLSPPNNQQPTPFRKKWMFPKIPPNHPFQ